MLTITTGYDGRKPIEKQIFKNNTATFDKDEKVSKIDREWLSAVFMLGGADLDPIDGANRYFSSAELKFTDTTMGGNIGINSRPQFTRYCDIRAKGRRSDRKKVTVQEKGSFGMGTYYSEAIDDNSLNLFMEFGVPKFNSLFNFFSRSIDPQASIIARTGSPSIAYSLGNIAGKTAIFLMLPVITVSIWGIKALSDIVLGDSPFNYYYLNPTMHTYWSTVNSIVMQMTTELGILIPTFMPEKTTNGIGMPMKIDQEDLKAMHEILPDIIGSDNYIDAFAIATRAQAMANKQLELERKMYESFVDNDAGAKAYIKNTVGTVVPNERGRTFNKWMEDLMKDSDPLFQSKVPNKDAPATPPTNTNADDQKTLLSQVDEATQNYKETESEKEEGWTKKFAKYFNSARLGGGGHAIFKVDYVGSINESFSNSVTDVPTASILNSIGKTAKEMKFSLAGGNIIGGTDDILAGIKNTITGGLDGATFGLSNMLSTLFGDAYIDVPKMWDDSTVSLPRLNYTMQLISPYGNVISQLQNIYIPLAMLLAGALPLATGKNSYTSPFICKAFLKGMHNVQLGMITDLSVTRGTSNLAFNKQKRVLAIDVSFSITDFSQMMTAPIDNSMFGSSINSGLDDNNVFGRYIATLASRDLLTDMYTLPKAKIRLSRLKYNIDKNLSASFWAFRAGNFAYDLVGFAFADKTLSLTEKN
jgi:hypothetical protein